VVRPGQRDARATLVPVGRLLFPLCAPAWRTGRNRPVADRAPVGVPQLNFAAAEKTECAMVEIVAVEIIHHHLLAGRSSISDAAMCVERLCGLMRLADFWLARGPQQHPARGHISR